MFVEVAKLGWVMVRLAVDEEKREVGCVELGWPNRLLCCVVAPAFDEGAAPPNCEPLPIPLLALGAVPKRLFPGLVG